MNTTMKRRYSLENLHCAGCANKIEKAIGELPQITGAALSFATKKMVIMIEGDANMGILDHEVSRVVRQFEPEVTVKPIEVGANSSESGHDHSHDHDHGHDHSHGGEGKGNRRTLVRVLGGLALFGIGFLVPEGYARIDIYLAAYLVAGYDVVWGALNDIRRGRLFDEKFLMTLATFAAVGIGEYPEAAAVMLFYKTGELFEGYAVDKSRGHIQQLMDLKTNLANRLTDDGAVSVVDTELIKVGELLLVRAGERIPLDGEVVEGTAMLDGSAITGEPVPFRIHRGEKVYGGFINLDGILHVRVQKEFAESTVGRIMELIENASIHKAETERFITKFARYYTPIIVAFAALLAVIPPIMGLGEFGVWCYRAAVFLVVSCPCALVISIPLGYFGGIGKASSRGILVKGGNYLESMKDIDTLLVDKTGTVTEGVFTVVEIESYNGYSKEMIGNYAAAVEQVSNHPVAQAIVKNGSEAVAMTEITRVQEIAGKGIKAYYQGVEVAVGNHRLMDELGITPPSVGTFGTLAYVAFNGQLAGHIVIADRIRPEAQKALAKLRDLGVRRIFMLTGDRRETAEKIGNELGLDGVHAELLPDMKVEVLQKIKAEGARGGKVAFVGDGINDAPSLALADVGISMGGLGADLAIEASDVVIMKDDLSKLADLVTIARSTHRVVWQNICFALGFKVVVLILGAVGIATMWEAVFADVGVAVLAIINASRINNA